MTTIAFATAPAPRLRLTSRGRFVLGSLAVVPVVAIALFLGLGAAPSVAAGPEAASTSFTYVSVAPGQSLWQLAEQVAPQADPREVVADILTLNNLSSGDIQPGQELAIPTQYGQ
ncbi:MAG: LysM peptidoglycan-binding domain-containing protein [Pseudolysinimonas sp.]